MIEFNHFTFKYRAQKEPTIKDIHLKIEKGEKVVIVGPSGSGKSTIGHCINGLVPFSYPGDVSGELTIDGKSPKKLGIFGMSKYVGTVLQDPDGQFIGLTVGEDIAFALENDCVPPNEMRKKVQTAAELVGISDYLTHSPQRISGGQKQRVAMAGVLVDAVDVLLFDEPLANLDPAAGKRTMELIDQIHKDLGTTIVIIEHRLEDVLIQHVDRIIVMNEGCIVADMKPNDILCTDLLQRQGIREPLYVTALKYAGCDLSPEDCLESMDSLRLDVHAERMKAWFQSMEDDIQKTYGNEILAVEQLSFSYEEGKPILSNVNFNIRRGEMVSIVGKNGAGKSTLSKLICGFLRPTHGRILYEGKDMIHQSIKQRAEHIGIVMQNPNQMISKPMIYDEVALGLRARGWTEDDIRTKVEQTLRICGLYPYRNWPISALSFGQKKRVTIASILVLDPDILLLDEPTAGQDFKHYTEIMEFLKSLNEEHGITILMITHDMHLMLEYTHRAIVISNGTLVEDTIPAKVLTDDAVIELASLKRTSLYDLALRSGIEDKDQFVERFIAYDRKVRGQCQTL